jgi:hypothetical protein
MESGYVALADTCEHAKETSDSIVGGAGRFSATEEIRSMEFYRYSLCS